MTSTELPQPTAISYGMRVIIIEGMDGTGKSGLVNRLTGALNLPIHERASSSVGGPVKNLFEWAEHDVDSWEEQAMSIYDRHPLVSEFIYGPVTRGTMDSRFLDAEGMDMSSIFANSSIVVFCDPGWAAVRDNLFRPDVMQMPGVLDNAKRLYLLYRSFFHHYSGRKYVWNYNTSNFQLLADILARYVREARINA